MEHNYFTLLDNNVSVDNYSFNIKPVLATIDIPEKEFYRKARDSMVICKFLEMAMKKVGKRKLLLNDESDTDIILTTNEANISSYQNNSSFFKPVTSNDFLNPPDVGISSFFEFPEYWQ